MNVPLSIAYTLWMEEVDEALDELCGLSAFDLPDGPSMDSFTGGMAADEYAQLLLEDAGFGRAV